MKITAITQDQLIIVGGSVADMGEIGGFKMERGEWAVHFDTDLGIGHVEYLDSRSNQPLTTELFNTHYTWLVTKHDEYVDWEIARQIELNKEQPTEQVQQ